LYKYCFQKFFTACDYGLCKILILVGRYCTIREGSGDMEKHGEEGNEGGGMDQYARKELN
jgi:hypothetical protein